ncbi:citrate synthase [Duganella sp. CF402]|uniref:citrate synthase family protein n=1 Tax=unclassified Duganella TaxID=2636909 RepID=UPI0008C82F73|nr:MULTISPECIES: citrate synthase family protein [unclassified Duganella]RZT11153.1 citrate synthase [Duganella sp. BK701]SEK78932.1 citrate synthase [Duganella sp. CF402]
MVWMTAAEALDVLNVRPQTLYANVSRGKIRAKPDGDDPRRSLYHRDDVLRMARRANGRRKVDIVSSEAMQYGDPVLPSAISTAANGKLLYRGHDAARLADSASLEDIAALLWECDAAVSAVPRAARQADARTDGALAAGLLALARRSAVDEPSLGRAPVDLRAEAAGVLAALVDAMTGGSVPASISRRLARHWRAERHEDLIRRALVLMADNELNASTFATRVAISTGASLAAGVLAGFTTLTGPLHGGAAREFAQLITQAQASSADDAVRGWLASGRPLPAFGHPLYSEGDPRAKALLRRLPKIQPYEALAVAAEQQAGELPNIDYALSLLTAHCSLPEEAPFVLFAVGRCVGWLAHALEQVQASRLIRPRARYTGPAEIISAGIY